MSCEAPLQENNRFVTNQCLWQIGVLYKFNVSSKHRFVTNTCVQEVKVLYTFEIGNIVGKKYRAIGVGIKHLKYYSRCVETQYIPNAIGNSQFDTPPNVLQRAVAINYSIVTNLSLRQIEFPYQFTVHN